MTPEWGTSAHAAAEQFARGKDDVTAVLHLRTQDGSVACGIDDDAPMAWSWNAVTCPACATGRCGEQLLGVGCTLHAGHDGSHVIQTGDSGLAWPAPSRPIWCHTHSRRWELCCDAWLRKTETLLPGNCDTDSPPTDGAA